MIYDDESNATKVTATVKAAAGLNPASSDWVFAVAAPNGVVALNDHGDLEFGALESCNGCHTAKLDTDGLFGL